MEESTEPINKEQNKTLNKQILAIRKEVEGKKKTPFDLPESVLEPEETEPYNQALIDILNLDILKVKE